MRMPGESKSVLIISMPYASIDIPSIQLSILDGYLKERDVAVKTYHLYLKAAEFYGINNYNRIILPPNDSYTAQMVFSKYVFPDHWNTYINFFKKYYQDAASQDNNLSHLLSFEEYVGKTDEFFNWAIRNTEWQKYDIIGFSLNYGQFLPSLAFAKYIKEQSPEKKIVFGGSRTTGILGKRILSSFDYIDYIVSGDGEDTLYYLATNQVSVGMIPGLIYKKDNEIIWNDSNNNIDINDNPCPSFDSFYTALKASSGEIQQFFNYYGRLPIEISRGCWWNRCTFCNLNLQYPLYREKNIDKIANEIGTLSNKYRYYHFKSLEIPCQNTISNHFL